MPAIPGRRTRTHRKAPVKYLRTSDIARVIGVHPNTVRLYEALGFLPPVPRSPAGYRLFTEAHLEHIRVVWMTLRCTWLGGDIRRTGLGLIESSKLGNLEGALDKAHYLLALVRSEMAQAEAAAGSLERWARETPGAAAAGPAGVGCLRIGEVAMRLNVTTDMLRNWERNGLVRIRRHPDNGYRLYSGADIDRIRIIRMLRQARYSTMSILRMLRLLDSGQRDGLRQLLNTPSPDDDVYYATDRWLSTLTDLERVSGFIPDLGQFYGLVAHWKEDATLVGADTLLSAPGEVPQEDQKAFERPARVPGDTRPLLVVPDSRGRIRSWHHWRTQPYWREAVVLCSRITPVDYLEYLRHRHVDYIIAGDDHVDFRAALEEINTRYGVKVVRVDSGGTLNAVLLRAGLVSEVSILVYPTIVGGASPSSIFRATDLAAGENAIDLRFVHVGQLEGGAVWLRYDVK
ncbi:MAG: MerR family transcriptional regulator [Firmicutes bacterium]|nr:MerR family transcriptional regulator [Bacillota bacterium]